MSKPPIDIKTHRQTLLDRAKREDPLVAAAMANVKMKGAAPMMAEAEQAPDAVPDAASGHDAV